MQPSSPNSDPCYHTANEMLGELIEHLREDTRYIKEPKAQALFKTEVLGGLRAAFTHYEERETAMRGPR